MAKAIGKHGVSYILLGSTAFVIQVGGIQPGQPTDTLINQQRLAAEAARHAASLQGSTQGAVQGAIPPAQGGPHCPPALTGRPVHIGRSAGMGYQGSASFAAADAVADDYDKDLQAALVASVTNQPGEWVNATHSTDVKPNEKPGETASSLPADCSKSCDTCGMCCTSTLNLATSHSCILHSLRWCRPAA